MNRRGLIGALLGAPAFGKAVLQDEALKVAGMAPTPGALDFYDMGAAPGTSGVIPRAAQVARVLGDPSLLRLVKGLAALQVGNPTRLDADLAANRSFSLSAKLRLQRERNVETRLRDMLNTEEALWLRLSKLGIDL